MKVRLRKSQPRSYFVRLRPPNWNTYFAAARAARFSVAFVFDVHALGAQRWLPPQIYRVLIERGLRCDAVDEVRIAGI